MAKSIHERSGKTRHGFTDRSGRGAVSRSRTPGAGSEANGGSQSKLTELFFHELKDIYHAEQQLTKALPKLAKAAASDELRSAFESHLKETEEHVSRLEEVFESFDEKPRAEKCEAMEGLIEEGKELLAQDYDESILDAALICAAQKVEHYEIASYGCLATWAKLLGKTDVAELLGQTLEEEKAADQKLTELAESVINLEAAGESQPAED